MARDRRCRADVPRRQRGQLGKESVWGGRNWFGGEARPSRERSSQFRGRRSAGRARRVGEQSANLITLRADSLRLRFVVAEDDRGTLGQARPVWRERRAGEPIPKFGAPAERHGIREASSDEREQIATQIILPPIGAVRREVKQELWIFDRDPMPRVEAPRFADRCCPAPGLSITAREEDTLIAVAGIRRMRVNQRARRKTRRPSLFATTAREHEVPHSGSQREVWRQS